ncbi:MAG: hypothetical protein JW995_06715 [Melioribacteraceae bacterium]|nr:hypothetical protein [Melioribacteraceae bacterium]
MNYEQITKLKTDGSGEMFVHYWTNFSIQTDSLLISKFGIFEPDSLKKLFSASFTAIEKIEVYKNYKDSTIHAKVELDFNRVDSLNFLNPFANYRYAFIKTDDENEIIFSHDVTPISTGFGFEDSSLTLEYTYYIPGKILEHNADKRTNNKLYWIFNQSEVGKGKEIYVKFTPYKIKETPDWIYFSALFVLIVVLIFIFKKRIT